MRADTGARRGGARACLVARIETTCPHTRSFPKIPTIDVVPLRLDHGAPRLGWHVAKVEVVKGSGVGVIPRFGAGLAIVVARKRVEEVKVVDRGRGQVVFGVWNVSLVLVPCLLMCGCGWVCACARKCACVRACMRARINHGTRTRKQPEHADTCGIHTDGHQ